MWQVIGLIFPIGLFSQSFMWNALISGTVVAILAAGVGFFAVLRDASFAAHALPKVGFAGAAGAVLMNVSPILGLVIFTVGGALGIGWLGKNGRHEVSTALLLVAGLGTGALFLVLNDTYAAGAYSLLFGQLVGVSVSETAYIIGLGIFSILFLFAIFRPLLFATISPEIAISRGVPVNLMSILYLILVGLTTAITVPVVGALLSFSLMVAPAATIRVIRHRPLEVVVGSMILSVITVWISLLLAFDTGWPVGFYVATIAAVSYGIARWYDSATKRNRWKAENSHSLH